METPLFFKKKEIEVFPDVDGETCLENKILTENTIARSNSILGINRILKFDKKLLEIELFGYIFKINLSNYSDLYNTLTDKTNNIYFQLKFEQKKLVEDSLTNVKYDILVDQSQSTTENLFLKLCVVEEKSNENSIKSQNFRDLYKDWKTETDKAKNAVFDKDNFLDHSLICADIQYNSFINTIDLEPKSDNGGEVSFTKVKASSTSYDENLKKNNNTIGISFDLHEGDQFTDNTDNDAKLIKNVSKSESYNSQYGNPHTSIYVDNGFIKEHCSSGNQYSNTEILTNTSLYLTDKLDNYGVISRRQYLKENLPFTIKKANSTQVYNNWTNNDNIKNDKYVLETLDLYNNNIITNTDGSSKYTKNLIEVFDTNTGKVPITVSEGKVKNLTFIKNNVSSSSVGRSLASVDDNNLDTESLNLIGYFPNNPLSSDKPYNYSKFSMFNHLVNKGETYEIQGKNEKNIKTKNTVFANVDTADYFLRVGNVYTNKDENPLFRQDLEGTKVPVEIHQTGLSKSKVYFRKNFDKYRTDYTVYGTNKVEKGFSDVTDEKLKSYAKKKNHYLSTFYIDSDGYPKAATGKFRGTKALITQTISNDLRQNGSTVNYITYIDSSGNIKTGANWSSGTDNVDMVSYTLSPDYQSFSSVTSSYWGNYSWASGYGSGRYFGILKCSSKNLNITTGSFFTTRIKFYYNYYTTFKKEPKLVKSYESFWRELSSGVITDNTTHLDVSGIIYDDTSHSKTRFITVQIPLSTDLNSCVLANFYKQHSTVTSGSGADSATQMSCIQPTIYNTASSKPSGYGGETANLAKEAVNIIIKELTGASDPSSYEYTTIGATLELYYVKK